MPLSFSSPISSTSPIVEKVVERKRRIVESRSKLQWALINFLAGGFLFLETEYNFFLKSSSKWRSSLSRIELAFVVIFFINAVLDLLSRLFPFGISHWLGVKGSLSSADSPPVLSPRQRKLLGVAADDPVFPSPKEEAAKKAEKAVHPFGFPSPMEGSFVASSTPTRAIHKPDYLNVSSPTSMLNSSASVLDASSWLYYKQPPISPSQQETPKTSQEAKRPAASPNGVISNEVALREFLEAKQEAKKDLNNSSTVGNMSSSVYWHHGMDRSGFTQATSPISTQDYSPILKKLSYQLSQPMPTVISGSGADDSSAGVMQGSGGGSMSGLAKNRIGHTSTELICHRLGISQHDLASWMQNLRLWLSQTILSRLIKEIDSVNQSLAKHGVSDLIGQVGVEKLRKYGLHFPEVTSSINGIIPFLEFTVHQDYLVHRLGELSRGGAISDYKWNGGSSNFKGQDWSEKFPTDSEIVINCFAAYLDICMPANYTTPEGKPFTNVYFVRAPEKADSKSTAAAGTSTSSSATGVASSSSTVESASHSLTVASRERCVITQAPQKPPYFYLQVRDDKLEVGPGRNNLFHTLLLFIHHIKTKENGALGRINFGVSGINILWIID